jgi:hypothetical protein
MSSIATVASVFKTLTSITAYREVSGTHGDTTTTSALARLAATIPVAAITNFLDLDSIVIQGDGGTELNSINGAPAGSNIVPARPIALVQSSGAAVKEMVASPAGHIAENSARFGGSASVVPIPAATSATPIGYFNVPGALSFNFGVLGFDHRSLAFVFGKEEDESGVGTAADPYQSVIGQSTVGIHNLLCFRARGVRKDGKIIEVDFCDVTLAVNADVNISGKQVNPLAVGGNCTTTIVRWWTA